METSTDIKEPNYIRPELALVNDTLTLMDDLLGGTPQMHAKSADYVWKWEDEALKTYNRRRVSAPCFEGLGRTLSAATGMLFSRTPVITWTKEVDDDGKPLKTTAEATLTPILDNVDLSGTKYNVLAQQFAERSIKAGLGVLLIDYTSPPKGIEIHAGNETELNLRPKWSLYDRATAICWNEMVVSNKAVLSQLSLAEKHSEVLPGEFGATVRDRFRDLRLLLTPTGLQAVWYLRELRIDASGRKEWVEIDKGVFKNRNGKVASFLPVAIAYAGRKKATMVASIPLSGTAYANKWHWLYSTNLNFNRDFCAFETLVLIGDIQDEPGSNNQKKIPGRLKVGPGMALHLKKESDAKWIAPLGKGNAELKEGKAEAMTEMDQQGLGFLVPGKAVQMTATGAMIESTAQLATLTSAGEGIQDALNTALEITAWYEGIEKKDAPTVQLHTKFDVKTLDAQTAGAFSAMVAAGQLTLPSFLKLLVRYGVLPDGFDVAAEVQALKDDPPIVALPPLNPTGVETVEDEEVPPPAKAA